MNIYTEIAACINRFISDLKNSYEHKNEYLFKYYKLIINVLHVRTQKLMNNYTKTLDF